jgi:putative ATPase
MLEADRLTSVIFYGPPGTGKTTLAQIIAQYTQSHFEQVNASGVGVKEVRAILDAAKERLGNAGQRTVLFLDEIHRFNRAQQDILLGDVESGLIILVGATTENPFFAVNSPLVSRSQIFQFQPLTEQEISSLVDRAIADDERGYGKLPLKVDRAAIEHWARISDGDARRALMGLEVAVLSQLVEDGGRGSEVVGRELKANDPLLTTHNLRISLDIAEQSMQRKAIVYDGTGDEHYDAASALIKSMRGSDPDAAVYWVARMLEAGEDPRFIARRIAILASEDIGNADPQAICVAAAAFDIVEKIGMPEAQLTLAQAAIYMATPPNRTPRRPRSGRPPKTSAKGALYRSPSTFAIRITRGRKDLERVRVISMLTTTRTGTSVRIIWAWRRRITRPPTAGSRPSWQNVCSNSVARANVMIL